jgi:hypothetical protein
LSQKGESALGIAIKKDVASSVVDLLRAAKADAAAAENVSHLCSLAY